MFFRYDLDILSPQEEDLLDADDRPGLRWSIGIPDRMVIALARINTLMEEHTRCAEQKEIQALEDEITRACKPVISSDPTLVIGRLVVLESWKLAGCVYLYMVGCLILVLRLTFLISFDFPVL